MPARFVTTCLTACLTLLAGAAAANTVGFEVLVNTAPLVGNAAGPFALDFQLNGSGPNTVVVSNFNFGGGAAAGTAVASNGAAGTLGTAVTLSDSSSFFNELYQPFTPGSTLSFFVSMTTTVTPTPDAFSFAILDGSLFNIPTTGLGDSLLLVNITRSTLTASDIETFSGVNPPGGPNYSNVTVLALPEPAAILQLSVGLAAFTIGRFLRSSSSQM